MTRQVKPLEMFKITIDPSCSRIETLAGLGMLSPQVLTSEQVRELSENVLAYIQGKRQRDNSKFSELGTGAPW